MDKHLTQELENRMADFRIERREFWLKEFPPLALMGVFVCFGMSYLVNTFVGPMMADWRLVAALFSVAALVPPVWMMAPEKPTYEKVALDKVLNQIGAAMRAQRSSQ